MSVASNLTALPTLDVVIPCYNEEHDIAQCLDLLLAQADDIAQIIVVDNNSTDTTPKFSSSIALRIRISPYSAKHVKA